MCVSPGSMRLPSAQLASVQDDPFLLTCKSLPLSLSSPLQPGTIPTL